MTELKPVTLSGLQVQPVVKVSWNNRFIETNCSELMQKTSLMLKYQFASDSPVLTKLFKTVLRQKEAEPVNRKSDLFKGFFYNPENYAYAKLSAKNRSNKVGSKHSSAMLLERACGEDTVKSIKLGVRLG